MCHDTITCYALVLSRTEIGSENEITELPELVSHYSHNPISDEVTLGTACEKRGDMKDHDTG